jgi:SNF2 family DNA or RNA helicase
MVKQRTPVDLVPKTLAAKIFEHKRDAVPWAPHPYQQRALKFELEHPFSGLFLDPGLGKTSITLATFKVLFKRRLMKRALVVAPLRAIYDVWPMEVADWRDFNDLGVAVIHGGGKDKALRQLRPEHQIALINFEALPWLCAKPERLRLLGADVLVIDESSRMKASNTVRFRALRKHLHEFGRRYILTGSPRPRNYLDLFGQVYLLDRGEALGEYVSHYRNRFFFPTGYQMREWELLPGADKEINKLVAPMVLRLDAKDYLKMPRELERIHYVELPPAARKEYDSIEETMMSTLFTAPMVNSASARSKCAQIADGAVYLDQLPADAGGKWPAGKARRVKVLHTAKIDALVDLYEELQGEPLLVAIGFHHDVDAVRRALGKGIPCINGETTRSQASEYIDEWNRGRLPLLMGHPLSMGHALNLQKFNARHVCFFYVPDDYDHLDQCFRRVWRQGNKAEFVMRHIIVARDTVDVAKLRNLKRKGDGQRMFLDAMRDYAMERGYRVPGAKKGTR